MGLVQLVLQSALMAAGTFLLGSAPLAISSLNKPRSAGVTAISIFSVGLLISTALSVIIPEGMSVVLSSVQNGREGEGEGEVHEHVEDPHESDIGVWVGAALCAGFLLMFCVHQYASDAGHDHGRGKYVPAGQSPGKRYAAPHSSQDLSSRQDVEHGYAADPESERIGNGNGNTPGQGDYFTVAASSTRTRRLSETLILDPLDSRSPAFSTFIGLLFHALADGISLGAASSFPSASSAAVERDAGSDNASMGLSVLVFISLIIHKAPVAFSLSTLLLSYAPTASMHAYKSQIRTALIWFSLATPFGAMVTWVMLKLITLISWSESMNEGAEEDGNVEGIFAGSMRGRLEFWTGMALLFSAGTFLFVSTHVMADMDASSTSHSNESEVPHDKVSKRARISYFLVGMLTPLLLSMLMGHHHGH